ncbi:helicase, putative [Ricinus communis]|uniref:Helicase, putative n=2 Tax=Ricinus communis TaxID=3988 RepID=B9RU66_RICCO|nr:helicase, putative [Ricinus communis]
MATISLRRTKDKGLVGLPSKSVETCYIELSQEERELYDQMEGEAKGVVQGFINAGSLTCNYSTVLCIILRLRQICNDLALCPSDLRALLPSNSIEDVSNNPELLEKVVAVLQDGEDFDCPICISPPIDTVITRCAHVFCRPCILKTLQRMKPCCPLCRRSLTMSDLFSAPPESSHTDNTEISSSKRNTSSKVSALLNLLMAARDKNPTAKSVIFSQFQKMLVLLEEPLKAAGFKILRLDGTMNAKKKAQVIKEFGIPGPNGPTVLLASLKASCAGINLAAASKVYLLEPWWNPAVEEQAMDRVHRIGQKEDVTVVRLITRNSIEERILEMQERKKKLAKEAFGRRGAKAHDVRTDDLRILMSL